MKGRKNTQELTKELNDFHTENKKKLFKIITEDINK